MAKPNFQLDHLGGLCSALTFSRIAKVKAIRYLDGKKTKKVCETAYLLLIPPLQRVHCPHEFLVFNARSICGATFLDSPGIVFSQSWRTFTKFGTIRDDIFGDITEGFILTQSYFIQKQEVRNSKNCNFVSF